MTQPGHVFQAPTTARILPFVCSLRIEAKGRSWCGTGFLIDARHVVTAAHNLFSVDYGSAGTHAWADKIDVIPGCTPTADPYGRWHCERAFCPTEWTQSPTGMISDYALLRLQGAGVPGLAVPDLTPDELLAVNVGDELMLSGYPILGHMGRELLEHLVTVAAAGAETVEYAAPTGVGHSGSPIWVNSGGVIRAVAIHTDTGKARRIGVPEATQLLAWTRS
jgi:V8-like Glu-specific endopeptidase